MASTRTELVLPNGVAGTSFWCTQISYNYFGKGSIYATYIKGWGNAGLGYLFAYNAGSATISYPPQPSIGVGTTCYTYNSNSAPQYVGQISSRTINVYSISTSAGSGGSMTGAGDYDEGASYTIKATPNSGYVVSTLTGYSGVLENDTSAKSVTGTANGDLTYYATFKKYYKISFSANGGSGAPSAMNLCIYGNYYQIPSGTPTRSGHTFRCWNTKSDGSGTNYDPGDSVRNLTSTAGGTVTLYAIWNVNPVVTFDANGGSVSETSRSVPAGTAVGALPTPTWSGWTFAGWFTSASGGSQVSSNTVINADTIFYAHWNGNPHNYTIKGDGGSTVDSGTYYTSTSSQNVSFTTPTKSHYHISSWSVSPSSVTVSGNNKLNIPANTISDITATASFTIDTYTITFNANGGTGTMASQSATYNTATALNTNAFAKVGSAFTGWNTKSDGAGTAYADGATVKLSGNLILYAQWSAIEYTVTTKPNGGTGGGSITYTYKTASQTKAVPLPTRTGYHITGWSFTGHTGSNPSISGSTLTIPGGTYGNITATPTWTANTYTIAFNKNSTAATGSTESIAATYGTSYNLTPNGFSRTGYTFQGWATSASGAKVYNDEQSVSNLSATNGATVTLYAVWSVNSYNITLAPGSHVSKVYYRIGTSGNWTEISASKTFSADYGSVVYGYATAAAGYTAYYPSAASAYSFTVSAARTVTFNAQANTYTVEFTDPFGGNVTGTQSMTYDTSARLKWPYSELEWTAPVGYTFAGWGTSESGGVVYANGATVKNLATSGTFRLYAKWAPNTYTIAYDANGGTGTTASQTATYDEDITLRASNFSAPTGMKFNGWGIAADAVSPSYSAGEVVKNLATTGTFTLYAMWTSETYTVIFNPTGGSVGTASKSVRYGEQYGTLPTPSRQGYNFAGWYTSEIGGTRITETSVFNVNSSQTLFAQWTANSYTITFNKAGGTGGSNSATVVFGEIPSASIAIPVKSGMIFAGYFAGSGGTGVQYYNAVGDGVNPYDQAHNSTVYAKWDAIKYRIIFDNTAGEGSMASQEVSYGSAPSLNRCTFTRLGYTFAGWNTARDGTGTAYADEGAVSPDLSNTDGDTPRLYAQWTPNTYTIKFNANGGTGSMPDVSATYDVSQQLPASTFSWDSAHKAFVGWSTDPAATDPVYIDGQTVSNLTSESGGTVTLYAVWKQKRRVFIESNDLALGTVATDGTWASGDWILPGTRVVAVATITDSSSTRFAGWYLDGAAAYSDSAMVTITVPDVDSTYQARFKYVLHTLEVLTRANGTSTVRVGGTAVDASSGYPVLDGQTVSLYAAGAFGYTATGWYVNGVLHEGVSYGFTVTENDAETITCYPVFTQNPHYIVTVSKQGESRDACTVSAVDEAGHTYSESFSGQISFTAYTGISYTVTASLPQDDTHVYFNGWTKDGSSVSSALSYTFSQSSETDVQLVASFRSTIHVLDIYSNAPDYGVLEAWVGNSSSGTKIADLSDVEVVDGQTITVRATASTLRMFNQWTKPDESTDTATETQFIVSPDMPHNIVAVASFSSRSSITLTVTKVNGSFGSIKVHYVETFDPITKTVGNTDVYLPLDVDGEIKNSPNNAFSGVSYICTAEVTDNFSEAGRQLTYFEGWYKKMNGEWKPNAETSSLVWTEMNETDIKAAFQAYTLCEATLGAIEDPEGLTGSVAYDPTNLAYLPDVSASGGNGPKWIAGLPVSFVATPATGYELAYFSIVNDGTTRTYTADSEAVTVDASGNATIGFPLGSMDFSVMASFSRKKFTITAGVDADSAAVHAGLVGFTIQGGEIVPPAESATRSNVPYGSIVQFTATPATGYGFHGWYDGSTFLSADVNYEVVLTAGVNIVAKFTATVNLRIEGIEDVPTAKVYAGGVPPASGWVDTRTANIVIGGICHVAADPEANFDAWYSSDDATFANPLAIGRVDSFKVTDNTTIVAQFLDSLKYVYIALINAWANPEDAVEGVVPGILSMTLPSGNDQEITEEEYNQGLHDVTNPHWGGHLTGAYKYYKFLGSKVSQLIAVENDDRMFNGWRARYVTKEGETSTEEVFSLEQRLPVRTSRHYVFTAVWGDPHEVTIELLYCNDSRGRGGLILDGETVTRTDDESGVHCTAMQGKTLSIGVNIANGYKFAGWFYDAEGTLPASNEQQYSFTVSIERHFYAKFVHDTNAIYKWEGLAENKTMRWRSKVYAASRPFDPTTARVDGIGYSVALTVDMFSAPTATAPTSGPAHKVIEVHSQNSRRLPKNRPERYMQLEIQSDDEVDYLAVGTSPTEVGT